MKILKHIYPVFRGIWMKIVSKDYISSPNSPNLIINSFGIFNKDISFLSLLVSISFSKSNAWLNDRNIMILASYFGHSVKRETFLVNCKSFIIFHVIDICPYSIQGYTIFLILAYHIFQSLYIFVSPSALVKAQSPKWWDCRSSNIIVQQVQQVLGHNHPQENSKIYYSSNCLISQLVFILLLLSYDIESIRGSEVAYMISFCWVSFQIYRVVSMRLLSSPKVHLLTSITRKHCPFSWFQSKVFGKSL